jgi:hypothetical protein
MSMSVARTISGTDPAPMIDMAAILTGTMAATGKGLPVHPPDAWAMIRNSAGSRVPPSHPARR